MRSPEMIRTGDSDDLTGNIDSEAYQKAFEERVNTKYAELLKEPAIARALELLNNLPSHLVYHTKRHTEDVIWETILFALADNVPENVVRQQAIAAAWHDVGFAKEKHASVNLLYADESAAIDMFRDPKTGGAEFLSEKDIWETAGNIWDTRVLSNGDSLDLEMRNSHYGYMLDADVSNFGRDDFSIRMEEVAQESGIDLTNDEARMRFYGRVLSLLRNHSWKTESARRLRDVKKMKNIEWLESEYLRAQEKLR